MTHTVIGVSPLGAPDPRLVAAVCRAGGSGVLDLGPGARAAREALTLLRQGAPGRLTWKGSTHDCWRTRKRRFDRQVDPACPRQGG